MRATDYFFLQAIAAFFAISECAPTTSYSQKRTSLKYITLEEHYTPTATRPYRNNPVNQLSSDPSSSNGALLQNINGSRLVSLKDNGIRLQVISNNPTAEVFDKPDVVQASNNELATDISPYLDQLRGFCYLPMAYPELAAEELERCITDLGFVGALVDSHLLNGTTYDVPEYDTLWEKLECLDVPLYLHPTYPPIQTVNQTGGQYAPDKDTYTPRAAALLATTGWGWHSDCGVQFLRLWLAGVFDRHPNVKVVLGHMGEMLPYMLERSSTTLGSAKGAGVTLKEAYAKNVWLTTSAFFSLDPFTTVLRTTANDRIMFSVDYPYSKNEDGAAFMEELRNSGMVSDEEWENIAFRNAEQLLRL